MPRQSPVKQVGQARSAATKVAGKVGAKVIEEVPVDQCLNKYFSVPEPWWLRVTLPLAEYLLLLTVLLLFLEVAPQDIPAKCSNKLQETCLRLYNVDRNGEFDAGFLQEACGTLRMNCWRGGIKAVIYNGEEMTDADLYYKAGVYDRVFNLLGEGTAAQSDLCQCMLTNNGTEQYPRSPNAARADTNYFCDAIIASQNLGTVGLILSALVIALKSKLEQLVEMDSVSDFQVAVMHLMIDAFWFAWSLAVVIETVDYATEEAYVKADCEVPVGTIFYYVFVLGGLSTVGAIYSTYIAIRVLIQLYREQGEESQEENVEAPTARSPSLQLRKGSVDAVVEDQHRGNTWI